MKLTLVVPAQKLITYLTATVELRKTSQKSFLYPDRAVWKNFPPFLHIKFIYKRVV